MKFSTVWTVITMLIITYGCASTGANNNAGLDRSEQAINSMEEVHDDLRNTLKQIDDVETSLQELIRAGQTDINSAFNAYSEDVSELEERGTQLLDNKAQMTEDMETYFSGWEEDGDNYNNERLKELSSTRRNELSENFSKVNDTGNDVERDLTDFISDTKEIRTYLNNDLTSAGIESVNSLAKDVIAGSSEVNNSLSEMRTNLENLISAMARRGN